jgi:hypothetical protein
VLGLPIRWLDETTLSSATNSVTFTLGSLSNSIPSGSRHLVLMTNARGDESATIVGVGIRFNGDTGSNYSDQLLKGASSTASAARGTGTTRGLTAPITGASSATSSFGGGYTLIPHYANTANHKAVLSMGGSAEAQSEFNVSRWANTAAITSVTLLALAGDFDTNSYFSIGVADERYAIGETILTGDTSNFTFSAIPAEEGDLVAVGYVQSDDAGSWDYIAHAINGDTTASHYSRQNLRGSSTSTGADTGSDRNIVRDVAGAGTANIFAPAIIQYSQYNRGTHDPHIFSLGGISNSIVAMFSGRRNDIEAITSLAFTPVNGSNWKSGSMMSLYYAPKRLLNRQVLASTATTIAIPVPAAIKSGGGTSSAYIGLELSVYGRSDESAAQDVPIIEFNSDTTASNYDSQELRGTSTTVSSGTSASDRAVLVVPGASATANIYGGGTVSIPLHTLTNRHKHFLAPSGDGNIFMKLRSNRWENTAAITTIDLKTDGGDDFFAGTVVELWGLIDPDDETPQTRATKTVTTV